ncbi:hypothetical protein EMIT0P171_30504 [Pseudomonas sp. IT-P171]
MCSQKVFEISVKKNDSAFDMFVYTLISASAGRV